MKALSVSATCLRVMAMLALLCAILIKFEPFATAQVEGSLDNGLPKIADYDPISSGWKKQLQDVQSKCSRGIQPSCLRKNKIQSDQRKRRNEFKKFLRQTKSEIAACEAGDAPQCYDLAVRQESKERYGPTSGLTRLMYGKSCEASSPSLPGCKRYAYVLYNGQGGAKEWELALAVYKKACDLGDAPSCSSSAFMYNKGRGTPQDTKVALEFYSRACDMGLSAACTSFAAIAEEFDPTLVADSKLEKYIEGCSEGQPGGDPNGCFLAAKEFGDQTKPSFDIVKATKFYVHSCAVLHEEGCYRAATAFENGIGVEADKAKAFDYYDASCKGFYPTQAELLNLQNYGNLHTGFERSCVRVSEMYLSGEGVSQSSAEAINVSQSACRQLRAPEICRAAGDILFQTSYLQSASEETISEIARYWTDACKMETPEASDNECWNKENNRTIFKCNAGNAAFCNYVSSQFENTKRACDYPYPSRTINSCLNTGFFYINYNEVRDPEAALKYYRQSCSNGNERGCEKVEQIETSQSEN